MFFQSTLHDLMKMFTTNGVYKKALGKLKMNTVLLNRVLVERLNNQPSMFGDTCFCNLKISR